MSYTPRHRRPSRARVGSARGLVAVTAGAALVVGTGALVQSRGGDSAAASTTVTAQSAAVAAPAPAFTVASPAQPLTPHAANAVFVTGGGATVATVAASRAAVPAVAAARVRMQRADVAAGLAGTPKQIAKVQLAQRGWGADQFACLDHLWTKESDWTATADNPTSDAYGIPQSLPGEKMASEGKDWRTNPATQIRWGLKYIAEVYQTPCGAWAHSRATDWY